MTLQERDPSGRPPVVTATRPCGRDRVIVELDGAPWRVVPLAAAARAGLMNGVSLDRQRARTLNRALRTERAFQTATRLLRYADHSAATLDRRLLERGVGEEERGEVVDLLTAVQAIDDVRFAGGRAAFMSKRGYGDAVIRDDLSARGLDDALIQQTLDELEPESVRAAQVVERRGASIGTLAYLSRKGFGEDALEAIVASVEANGLG